MKEFGYEGWRDKYRYGQRWMTEAFFNRKKRIWGVCSIKKLGKYGKGSRILVWFTESHEE
ncbi:MAG: hypothetical protein DRN33_05145 [Thermoplasmata archaeon]|nr:MAG: hypothetical protein DRN33_05145 [Thermoplasmata archaeon]